VIEDHDRFAAGQRGRHERVAPFGRVDHPGVDGGVGHHLGIGAGTLAPGRGMGPGHEQQRQAVALERLGQPVEDDDGGRVGEGVGQRLAEQDPDGPDPLPSQPAGQGTGSRETELGGPLQYPDPQGGGQLVGMVVGVGHGGP
jgi:hypothetical protein